jgi:hypothetical protein
MLELIAGVLVAGAAVVMVLEPLWRPGRAAAAAAIDDEPEFVDPEDSESPKIKALLALRELEFDHSTGKLSDEDYQRGKARYEKEAVEAIKAERAADAAAEAGDVEDAAERAIEAAKAASAVCPSCGPRPEGDATFCSSCGRSLQQAGDGERCVGCNSALPEGATFCSNCGSKVAAPVPS